MINLIRTFIALVFLFIGSAGLYGQAPDSTILTQRAPDKFQAVFETTKGRFIIEAYRNWSPQGVDRLYQLISTGYFTNCLLFRVEPAFVVQFGIGEDAAQNEFWRPRTLDDEPVLQSNIRGTIAYARDVKKSRSTQLFINMVDNPQLDTTLRYELRGFTPIARVVQGMTIISSFYSAYKKEPVFLQDSLYKYGNWYYEKKFPGLDRILSARILP
ncbi:MAG: peptidylprolyl isomerase [Chitinophagaceae bacterium]|nr:peptidylprolyl isomerase [Chitinophagaceae bacterium]